MMKLLFLFLTYSILSFAGFEVGNGAVVVVCKDKYKAISSVELLDIYELRQRLNVSSSDFEQKNKDKINWISKVYIEANRRGLLYKYYYDNFFLETVFQYSSLPLTNDYGLIGELAKNCSIEQLVFQTSKAHPFDSVLWKGRYRINLDLWDKMSELNKQATILHEIIYRERITQCIQFSEKGCYPEKFNLDSVAVRKLVSHYFSNDFEHSTKAFINHLYQSVGLRRFESQGVVFVDKVPEGLSVMYDSSGIITINIDEMEKQDMLSGGINSFFISDYFDRSFAKSNLISKVKLKIKNYELLLFPNFKVRFDEDKVVITEGNESLFSVVIVNNVTGVEKKYMTPSEIHIDKMGSITIFE